jgi:hypothetical protein
MGKRFVGSEDVPNDATDSGGVMMNIDLVNFSRHAKTKELRGMVGRQMPLWIQELLRKSREGDDPGELIGDLATVCNITEQTEVLPL